MIESISCIDWPTKGTIMQDIRPCTGGSVVWAQACRSAHQVPPLQASESIEDLVGRLAGYEGQQLQMIAGLQQQRQAAESQAEILQQALEQQLLR